MDALKPLIRCRCCGEPVQTAEQKTFEGPPLTLLTCTNVTGKCDLCGHTFTADDYFDRDLSAYHWRDGSRKTS